VSGFGIGSLLTPLLAVRVGTKLAVAAVSVPHLAATALRFWLLRQHVDRRLLLSFGLMSAAGDLAGALLHAYADNPILTVVSGGLLVFTGVMGLTGLSEKRQLSRLDTYERYAWDVLRDPPSTCGWSGATSGSGSGSPARTELYAGPPAICELRGMSTMIV
jgi:uncharacterized membrane protein YfcA